MTQKGLTAKQRRALKRVLRDDISITENSRSILQYETAKRKYAVSAMGTPGEYQDRINVIANFLQV